MPALIPATAPARYGCSAGCLNGNAYVQTALKDEDEDIRITAIRAAKETGVSYGNMLVADSSAAVRRQLLLAMHHSREKDMPANWALLAAQYNGKDRWYLEALGIAADGNWEACFNEWRKLPPNTKNPAADHDIIWRARTPAALPLLAALILEPGTDPAKQTLLPRIRFLSRRRKHAGVAGITESASTRNKPISMHWHLYNWMQKQFPKHGILKSCSATA